MLNYSLPQLQSKIEFISTYNKAEIDNYNNIIFSNIRRENLQHMTEQTMDTKWWQKLTGPLAKKYIPLLSQH